MVSYIVDSFTKEAFKGNPAAVCFPGDELSDESMLQIAQEFGLSETAFVRPTNQPGIYRIRYFSPKKEIPLCGHATLASAKVVFEENSITDIHFITGENIDLHISRDGDNIVMEFPAYQTIDINVPTEVADALGITLVLNTAYSEKSKIIVLEIEGTDALVALKPDFGALIKSYSEINGVLVTAKAGTDGYDYHYRYFWPWAGTNEDPVTGGVQTFLAPYWGKKLGKKIMNAYQSSSRTGSMVLELKGDKVLLKSQAVIVLKGELLAFNNENNNKKT
jgi:PhzF family phenazine biosynthesis protein